jgi:DNA-binding NtrC family response regulator
MQELPPQPSIAEESPREPATLKKPAAPEKASVPARRRILVMDDETSILELTARMLGSQGYDVETSLNGTTAVKIYRTARDAGRPFDVVILDLTVPEGMGGYDAFKAMQAFDPGVKAILSSGYSHEPVVMNYKKYGLAGVAPKPYRVHDLVGAVEGVLGKG